MYVMCCDFLADSLLHVAYVFYSYASYYILSLNVGVCSYLLCVPLVLLLEPLIIIPLVALISILAAAVVDESVHCLMKAWGPAS